MSCIVLAPAKVNLFLKVLGKRQDTYHELLTVFQTVDLVDIIHCSLKGEGIIVDAPAYLPTGEGNLVYAAARLFYDYLRLSPRVTIRLEKAIPLEAGLGGGSSDAAAVLRGLNHLYDTPLTGHELQELASQLGSDVPFFLYGGTAIGRSRGEIIEPWEDVGQFWLRLIKPPWGLSTAQVYKLWAGPSDADWECFRSSITGRIRDLRLYNDLEQPAQGLRPELRVIKQELLQDGACAALLSGSGSTVFGLYDYKPTTDIWLPAGYKQWIVNTLTRAQFQLGLCMGKECNRTWRRD